MKASISARWISVFVIGCIVTDEAAGVLSSLVIDLSIIDFLIG
jgi:hypothetical protein